MSTMIPKHSPPKLVFGYACMPPRMLGGRQSLESQAAEIRRFYEEVLKPQGYRSGIMACDIASSRSFRLKPKGGRLFRCLRPDDILLISYSHRAFKNTKDLVTSLDELIMRQVRVCLLDFKIDTSLPEGRVLLDTVRETIKFTERAFRDYNQGLRKKPNGNYPYVVDGSKKRLKYSNMLRRMVSRMIVLREEEGLDWEDIRQRLIEEKIQKPRMGGTKRKVWLTDYKCKCLIEQEKQLRIIEEAFPHVKFPKHLTENGEDFYDGIVARVNGFKAPSSSPSDWPLITPVTEDLAFPVASPVHEALQSSVWRKPNVRNPERLLAQPSAVGQQASGQPDRLRIVQ